MRRFLLTVAAAVGSITPAAAWDVAPDRYVGRTTSVVLEWPQHRLQALCAPEAREAVDGHRILACTWTAAGLCFTAVDIRMATDERAALLYYHEWPHCAGWGWDHPAH